MARDFGARARNLGASAGHIGAKMPSAGAMARGIGVLPPQCRAWALKSPAFRADVDFMPDYIPEADENYGTWLANLAGYVS